MFVRCALCSGCLRFDRYTLLMTDKQAFLLQRVQPAMTGLIDGSLSTLAPIFAIAIHTHKPFDAFIAGVATAIGAGISMAFSEGLSDTGELTGRGNPMVRGSITGVGTFVGGILHTFGPDTLILEVQQTSDLGQFVMPFDLYGNRLDEQEWDANIEATLDELKTDYLPRPNPGLVLEDDANRRVLCCAGPHFALERWTLKEMYTEPSHPRRFLTLSNVGAGTVELESEDGSETLGRAESCILPAAIGEVRVVSRTGEATLVACYVPDLERDVVGHLREAGYSDEEIRALGEVEI